MRTIGLSDAAGVAQGIRRRNRGSGEPGPDRSEARLAERLKMSRNEFVVQAVEHFTAYLDSARDLDALDEEPE